jgi:hypothetical protein
VRWFHGIGGVGEQPVLNADSEARKVVAGIPVADDRVRIQPSQLLLQSRFDYVAARCLCSRLVDFEFKQEVRVTDFVCAVEYPGFVG